MLPAKEGLSALGRAQNTCGPVVLEAKSAVSSWSSYAQSWPSSQRCIGLDGRSHS